VVVRRYALVVVTLLFMACAPAVAQSPEPGTSGSPTAALCLVSLDELNELSGLRFVSTAAGPSNCTYDSDPAEDLFTLDLRIEAADPSAVEPMEDGLWFVRFDYEGGHDTTVAGLPAWEADDGIWVDIGDDVFVAQPILLFMSDPPDPATFLAPLAELAVSRLPETSP
jgi:hypothetical protein